jgi:predicted neuraminidase
VLLHNPSRRDRLALALAASQDGVRFAPGCALVAEGSEGEVAYPTVIRAGNRAWHVVYSSGGKRHIRHRRFDAAWLRACLAGQSNGSVLDSTVLSDR